MKKNLRIVSAAAAALLAVAPVAASAVSVSADVNYGEATKPAEVTKNTVGVTVNLGDIVNQPAKNVLKEGSNGTFTINPDWMKNVSITLKTNDGTTPTLVKQVPASAITLSKVNGTIDMNGNITAGQYTVTIAGMQIGGLINSKTYSAAGKGTFSGEGVSTTDGSAQGKIFNQDNGVTYSETFSIFDKNAEGNPYFVNVNSNVQIPDKGTVSEQPSTDGLKDSQSVLDAAIKTVKTEGTDVNVPNSASPAAKMGIITTADDIKKELTDQKVLKADGSVDTNKSFTVTLTAQNAVNGKTVSVKVNFVAAPEYSKLPIMYYLKGGKNNNNSWDDAVQIKQGNHKFVGFPDAIQFDSSKNKQFKPTDYFKAATADNKAWTNNFTVEENTVDSNKNGVYSVTVSAKNAKGETKVTVPVVVINGTGKAASIKNTEGFPVTLYKVIDGNAVKEENNYENLYNGDPVLTFESKTIGDTSYTRIQKINKDTGKAEENDNLWVESSKLSDYVAPAKDGQQRAYNKKYTKVYDKNGEALNNGKIIGWKIGSGHNLSEKTYTINGNKYYKVLDGAFKGNFVRVENFTNGRVKKTVKVRSRVYNSNKKVVKKHGKATYINKGRVVTVYGEKNGMFNIGGGKYLLKQNF